ncbi:unnamed protein product [Lymnaea stagnalis]|uniref:Secreted protein n=1 Tax=Lymnaea stagnalis TaxID=6523 RepID=A0AAV2H1A5_LYMST
MLTHFSWLWMFTWAFICCFHMFRVFTAKTCCSSSTSRADQEVVIIFSFPPFLWSPRWLCHPVMTSPDQNSGYGQVTCYLKFNSTHWTFCRHTTRYRPGL